MRAITLLRKHPRTCLRPARRFMSTQTGTEQTALILHAYADGASRGNPGLSGCGALLMDPKTQRVITESCLYLGDQETNNGAEYSGLLLALGLAEKHLDQFDELVVYMDSQLIVRQMQGQYKVKAAKLKQLHRDCLEEVTQMESVGKKVTFQHVLRADNKRADQLANQAIDFKDR